VSGFEAVIGLEIHAQLKTCTKMFCGCLNAFGGPPNTRTCPVCLGLPGALPVVNRRSVELAITLGIALDCRVERSCVFARKNYFYPDLPKGYQITQYDKPLCTNGHLDFGGGGRLKRVGIRRVHLEEDAGKSVHDPRRRRTLVDFNRAGVPLVEIVTEPEIASSQEAGAFLRELHAVLVHLGVSDGSMEEGSFRCDANVSVRRSGERSFGVRTELKNMNSFRNVIRALDFEIERQTALRKAGLEVTQETLLWSAALQKTIPMRSKEESHDYRYFPDPDLVPVVVDREWVERIRGTLGELPAARRRRFMEHYGLSEYDAWQLTATPETADYFERCVALLDAPKDIANWIVTGLGRLVNERGVGLSGLGVTPRMLAGLVDMVLRGRLSGLAAKEVLERMADSGRDAESLVGEMGLEQVTDEQAIRDAARRVMEGHPGEVGRYRAGKTQLAGFFVGEVMKATGGRADPKLAARIIREMLES